MICQFQLGIDFVWHVFLDVDNVTCKLAEAAEVEDLSTDSALMLLGTCFFPVNPCYLAMWRN